MSCVTPSHQHLSVYRVGREWCQVYLKAARLAEGMQIAAMPHQAGTHSTSPDSELGISHGIQSHMRCLLGHMLMKHVLKHGHRPHRTNIRSIDMQSMSVSDMMPTICYEMNALFKVGMCFYTSHAGHDVLLTCTSIVEYLCARRIKGIVYCGRTVRGIV